MSAAPAAAEPVGAAVANESEPFWTPDDMAALGRLSVLARRLAPSLWRGRRRARRVGGGSELVDTRPYALGDDPREIAWHVYARLDRLVVRVRADEMPLRVALVVDASASMGHGRPSKLRQAARVAAGLAAVALAADDRVAAVVAGAVGGALATSGGRAALPKLLSWLGALRPAGQADLVGAAVAASAASRGRALCIFVSDFLCPEGALAGPRAARSRGHDVALVQVLDPSELDPSDPGDVDLEDEETGEVITLRAGSALAAYRAALAAHQAALEAGAAEIGAPLLVVRSDEPFEEVVSRAMRRGLLRAGGAR
ncbi:MAG: DUF58 domain-containing protein [Polyangiaceae bacterium]|jgi:uncharacterized protein (DUF58 family)|nr:DUF58 domain-containing protein [Polyangiaceae bacterium]